MQEKLNTDGIGQICQTLEETGSLIAGSYVMQAILNENWPGSDIDIWSVDQPNENDFTPLSAFWRYLVKENGWVMSKSYETKCSNNFFNRLRQDIRQDRQDAVNMPEVGYRRLKNWVKLIYNFTKPGHKKIQLILLNPDTMEVFRQYNMVNDLHGFIGTFDIKACQVSYGPSEDNLCNITGVNDAIQQCRERVINLNVEELQSQYIGEWLRTLKRIQKYCNRDFRLNWTPEITQALEESLEDFGGSDNPWRDLHITDWNVLANEISIADNCSIPQIPDRYPPPSAELMQEPITPATQFFDIHHDRIWTQADIDRMITWGLYDLLDKPSVGSWVTPDQFRISNEWTQADIDRITTWGLYNLLDEPSVEDWVTRQQLRIMNQYGFIWTQAGIDEVNTLGIYNAIGEPSVGDEVTHGQIRILNNNNNTRGDTPGAGAWYFIDQGWIEVVNLNEQLAARAETRLEENRRRDLAGATLAPDVREDTRTTVWEQLCDLPVSTERLERLKTIRRNMNYVLVTDTINTGDTQADICRDIQAIVQAYQTWADSIIPNCSNDFTTLADEVKDLGFGELIFVRNVNIPEQYYCFSVEEINRMAQLQTNVDGVQFENIRNPYDRSTIDRNVVERALSFSEALKDYYENIQEEVVDPYLKLESILSDIPGFGSILVTRPVRETLQRVNVDTITREIANTQLFARDIENLGLTMPYDTDSLVSNVLIPLMEIEDENTVTRKLTLATLLGWNI